MPELIKMNGAAVNAISCFRRSVAQPDGADLDEFQVAVMLRGRMTHRSFATLLESGAIRIESGSGEARDTNVTAASVTSTISRCARHRPPLPVGKLRLPRKTPAWRRRSPS
jgi:hypothetical protein